jgi:diaminopimelate epimerase
MVRVNMGAPILESKLVPVVSENEKVIDEEIEVEGQVYHMTCVSMGNPHAVVYMDDVANLDIEKVGPFFENHVRFPERTNTEFVKVIDRNTVEMRVWERGTGETLACGTGCCAIAVSCVLNGLTDNKVTVRVLGGEIICEWNQEENVVYMTGPAVTVFDGEVTI